MVHLFSKLGLFMHIVGHGLEQQLVVYLTLAVRNVEKSILVIWVLYHHHEINQIVEKFEKWSSCLGCLDNIL